MTPHPSRRARCPTSWQRRKRHVTGLESGSVGWGCSLLAPGGGVTHKGPGAPGEPKDLQGGIPSGAGARSRRTAGEVTGWKHEATQVKRHLGGRREECSGRSQRREHSVGQDPRADRLGQGPATLMGKTAHDERGCGMGKHIHTEDVERTGHAHDCRSSLAPPPERGWNEPRRSDFAIARLPQQMST